MREAKINSTLLTKYLEKTLVGFLFLIFSITLVLVLLRYVFNQSITGANEIVTILFIYTTALGSAVSIGKNEHISINVFINSLSPKNYNRIKILQLLLLVALHTIIFFYCLGWIDKAGGYLMPATGFPRIVAIGIIPIGCLLSLIYCIKNIINEVSK